MYHIKNKNFLTKDILSFENLITLFSSYFKEVNNSFHQNISLFTKQNIKEFSVILNFGGIFAVIKDSEVRKSYHYAFCWLTLRANLSKEWKVTVFYSSSW